MRCARALAEVLLAAVALSAAAACTGGDGEPDTWPDPAVAAYVAGEPITEAELDEVAGELRDELAEEVEAELARLAEDDGMGEAALAEHEERRFGELDAQVAQSRTRVLEMRILTETATGYAEAEGHAVPGPALAQHAHELGLAEDNAYVRVVGEFYAVMGLVQSLVTPAEPSPADQREVYDVLVEQGLTTTSFEEAQQVLTMELMGEQVALRDLLRRELAEAQVRVGPGYDLVYELPVTVGSGEAHLALPLDPAD